MTVKKWVAKVDTESTFPEEGLFKQDAETIAKELASKKVSPKGPASGMRMLNFYLNRGGKNLTEERHAELEKAKGLLSERIAEEKGKGKPAPKKHTRTAATASKKQTAAKTRASKAAGRKSVKTARAHKS
jgi:topoisomerase IA-like protein